MPAVKTGLIDGIRQAINGREHFVFITDLAEVHLALVGLAAACILQGDCTEAEVSFAAFEFVDASCGRRSPVSILAIPKHALTVEDLHEFLGAIGFRAATRLDKDLIPLGSETEFLVGVLDSLRRGTARVAGEPATN